MTEEELKNAVIEWENNNFIVKITGTIEIIFECSIEELRSEGISITDVMLSAMADNLRRMVAAQML